MLGLFFEEIEMGLSAELGACVFTREKMLDFARQFDPQPFHVDDAAAASGPFGRLAASGWHTAAGWMKCYVASNDAARARLAAAGKPLPAIGPSPGFTALRWAMPVYPGDEIAYRSVVTGKRELSSRPAWGIVETHNTGTNQNGAVVFSFEGKVLTARRG